LDVTRFVVAYVRQEDSQPLLMSVLSSLLSSWSLVQAQTLCAVSFGVVSCRMAIGWFFNSGHCC